MGKPVDSTWKCASFEQLSNNELYALLKLRQDVFVIEQNCIYPDMDDVDRTAWHVIGQRSSQHGSYAYEVEAYCRLLAPGVKYAEASIGRVATSLSARGNGLGRRLLTEALVHCDRLWPKASIRISAQSHLQRFYADFNFRTVSDPYDEDGIPHVEMLHSKHTDH